MTASYNVYKAYTGEYAVVFLLDGRINYNERGTSGTGTKLFNSKNEAENAGKRYLMKMKKNGFSIKDSKEDKSVKVYDPVLCMVVDKPEVRKRH